MKKIITLILAVVMACMMLTGCDLSEEEEWAALADSLAATAPAETDPVVGPVATEAPGVEATEPAAPVEPEPSVGWEYGDEVWFIEWSNPGDGWPYPGVVVDVGESHLVISRGWATDGELIVAALGDCYLTFEAARIVTGKEVVGEGCR